MRFHLNGRFLAHGGSQVTEGDAFLRVLGVEIYPGKALPLRALLTQLVELKTRRRVQVLFEKLVQKAGRGQGPGWPFMESFPHIDPPGTEALLPRQS